jgi:flagellar basal body-associated protein FliL
MHQRGSAHIIVIMILIIALFAALGVVFYQNFIVKKTDTSQSSQPVVSSMDTLKTARVAFNSSIYALDYPKDWNGDNPS